MATGNDSVLNETIANASSNGTDASPPEPAGVALAYGSLLCMAIVPIIIGSIRSSKVNSRDTERVTRKDAALFPIYASVALFGIYLVFKFFSKEYINLLLSVYFSGIGSLAVFFCVRQPLGHWIPNSLVADKHFQLRITEKTAHAASSADSGSTSTSVSNAEEVFKTDFTQKDVVVLAASAAVGVWYFSTKHWLANDIIGLTLCVDAIELIRLDKVSSGCLLLGGLFLYDVWWVFGTEVMVSVAKSFDAPIKLVFPQDLLTKGLAGSRFAMLGLGDIVVPGIFIALLLRYERSKAAACSTTSAASSGSDSSHRSRSTNTPWLFYVGMVAYFIGLATTIAVLHAFEHAQPALLYLVPSCLGLPLLTALMTGQIDKVFAYEEKGASDVEEAPGGGLFDTLAGLVGWKSRDTAKKDN